MSAIWLILALIYLCNAQDATPSENGNTTSCTMSAQPSDPASGCCGFEGLGPKIFGGTEAGIDQYPWLALIEYEREHQIKQLCVGALISGRYVLTAAHCVVGPAMIKNIPKNVRLGEYDTEKATDCVEFEGGDEGDKECTLGPVIIPIEHIITHPDYKVYARNFRNDIALLRLASIPEYTEFVRPICLPTVDSTGSFQGASGCILQDGAISATRTLALTSNNTNSCYSRHWRTVNKPTISRCVE
ncbi:phenoloxidase-activating enzyme-like isoform X2 [Choristoneura fumiferana]|uniref:phenoloxidase-activating enzyme-like isoform X2 n=1 Tax=Choristoneura fumiferana TaxID=7141 RepID=UPI003D15B3D3